MDEGLRSVGWQQKCQISAVRHKLPCSWEEEETSPIFQRTDLTDLAQGPVLLLPGYPCTCYRETGMNTRKICVEKWPDIFPKGPVATQAKHPSSHQHNVTSMQSWRWVIPRFALISAAPHKDNLTILTLPQLYVL